MKKPCCQETSNLDRQVVDADRTIDVCRVCGCKHYRLKADPVLLGVKGSAMGPKGQAE